MQKIPFLCSIPYLLDLEGDENDNEASPQPPSTRRIAEGVCTFPNVYLLPPPPSYKPSNLDSEKSSSDLPKSKQQTKKPAATAAKGEYYSSM